MMPARLGQDIAPGIRVAAGLIRHRALHHQPMKIAHIHFGQRRRVPCQFADVTEGFEVIDGFEVIFERLTADGDALAQ